MRRDYVPVGTVTGSSWSTNIAWWVLVGLIIIGFFLYLWKDQNVRRELYAAGFSELKGRVDCLEPVVKSNASDLYKTNADLAKVEAEASCTAKNVAQLDKTVYIDRCAIPLAKGCCD